MLIQQDTGLVLIDVQGKLARIVNNSDLLISNIKKLILGCQILEIPIVWVEQYPKGLGHTVPELQVLLANLSPIEKTCFNAFENEIFKESIYKSNRKQWLLCGIEAHICVYQTAMGLLTNGFQIEIVSDCMSSRSKESVEIALKKLQNQGAGITNLEMCLYELIQNANKESFKSILKLIK